MGSRFLPSEAFGSLAAILDDPATAQFDHRIIAYAVLAFALIQAIAALQRAAARWRAGRFLLAAVAALQVALGVATLLLSVPIPVALAHQATALVLFGLAVWHWTATRMESAGRGGTDVSDLVARLDAERGADRLRNGGLSLAS